jgi:hypothetical protein
MRPITSPRTTLAALAITAACVLASPAWAANTILVDRTLPPQVKVARTEFTVDDTGRAQLAVDFFDDTDEGYLTSESVDVPGLRFDRERGEVIYESDGSVLTCARRQKILWGTRYKETGACRISVRSEKPTVEAGSRASAAKEWVVELVTEEPTKAARLAKPAAQP